MEYRILDNSLWTNPDGSKELFLQIEITNGTDVWRKAARIPGHEVLLVVADSTAINGLALAMAEKAVLTRSQEKIDVENERLLRLEQIKLEVAQEEARIEQTKLAILQEQVKLSTLKE